MDYTVAHRLKPSAAMRSEIRTIFGQHMTYITGTPAPAILTGCRGKFLYPQ